jgi:acetylornithine deacetylase/succinyl-diaminopimelate desuccinylase-like protein
MKINRIIHVAVGSRRYKVTVTARGGHSWGHFPAPSAIHILGRAIADISRLEVPADPKTTYNVGVIHGGTTVTHRVEADMLVDMRSVDIQSLADLSGGFSPSSSEQSRRVTVKPRWHWWGPAGGSIPPPTLWSRPARPSTAWPADATEASSTDVNAALGVDSRRLHRDYRGGQRAPTGRVHRDRADPTRVKNILLATVAWPGRHDTEPAERRSRGS